MLQSKIRSGELDRQVTFIAATVSRGTSNQGVETWAEIASTPTVFSRKTEYKGTEVVVGDQLKYIQKTVFTIRYRTDLTVKNRLVFDGKVYEILSITESSEQRKTFLDVVANLIDHEVWT